MTNYPKVAIVYLLYYHNESYIDNLNRYNAYAGLRKERALMREKGKDVCSIVLAKGLQKYSERGQAYIRQVQLMIRRNDFKAFDQAQLQL